MAYFALLCVFFGSNAYLNMSRTISKCARLYPLATSCYSIVFFLASFFPHWRKVLLLCIEWKTWWALSNARRNEKRICVIASTLTELHSTLERKSSASSPGASRLRQVGDISKTAQHRTTNNSHLTAKSLVNLCTSLCKCNLLQAHSQYLSSLTECETLSSVLIAESVQAMQKERRKMTNPEANLQGPTETVPTARHIR